MAPKREKGQTMSLADFSKAFQAESFIIFNGFLQVLGTSGGLTSSWADEDLELPTAPLGQDRSPYENRPGRVPSRGYGRDEVPLPVVIDQHALPREPPFLAFVGNLAYDATEEEIRTFFSGIAVGLFKFSTKSIGQRG